MQSVSVREDAINPLGKIISVSFVSFPPGPCMLRLLSFDLFHVRLASTILSLITNAVRCFNTPPTSTTANHVVKRIYQQAWRSKLQL